MDDLCSLSVPEGNVGTEISNAEYELLSPLVEGKKSRKLLHEGNFVALLSFCIYATILYILC